MESPLQNPQGSSDTSSNKVCHICKTKSTTQWRYTPDNATLCNPCGIRWKRQNKALNQEKRKPGRKKSQSHATASASRAHHSQSKGHSNPSSSAGPSNPKSVSIEALLSPIRSHSQDKKDTSQNKQGHDRHGSGRNHRSKMAISQLVSPEDEEHRPRSQKH